nr:hypothetical protein Iba_chr07dCG1940 [Ipomoea batatas]GMD20195.1 hypothetical protein Iba_chr07fCG2540 [Ipomoea batatas]
MASISAAIRFIDLIDPPISIHLSNGIGITSDTTDCPDEVKNSTIAFLERFASSSSSSQSSVVLYRLPAIIFTIKFNVNFSIQLPTFIITGELLRLLRLPSPVTVEYNSPILASTSAARASPNFSSRRGDRTSDRTIFRILRQYGKNLSGRNSSASAHTSRSLCNFHRFTSKYGRFLMSDSSTHLSTPTTVSISFWARCSASLLLSSKDNTHVKSSETNESKTSMKSRSFSDALSECSSIQDPIMTSISAFILFIDLITPLISTHLNNVIGIKSDKTDWPDRVKNSVTAFLDRFASSSSSPCVLYRFPAIIFTIKLSVSVSSQWLMLTIASPVAGDWAAMTAALRAVTEESEAGVVVAEVLAGGGLGAAGEGLVVGCEALFEEFSVADDDGAVHAEPEREDAAVLVGYGGQDSREWDLGGE